MTFAFLLPSLFWFPIHIFLKKLLPLPNLVKIYFSPWEKEWNWEGVENYVYSSNNLKIINNIWQFLCLAGGAFWIFECFYNCLPCLIWFFTKTQNFHFHDQIKQKICNKVHPSIKWEITNPNGNFSNQINLKELSFSDVKVLWWFAIFFTHFKIHF